MRRTVVVDAGPLVAFLSPRDRYHRWASEAMRDVRAPLLTTEPVLTEAFFLLRKTPHGTDLAWELLARGMLSIELSVSAEAQSLRRLMAKYADVPMSVADASLVRLSELRGGSTVMTLDSDFRVYRRHGRQAIPLISPG